MSRDVLTRLLAVTDRPLLAVDAPSLYFRAFHGIPENAARTDAGEPVNAIRGFMDMIAQLVRTRQPDRVVCALDADWRPAWRVALVPSYKKHRVAARRRSRRCRPPWRSRSRSCSRCCEAVGIPAFGVAGYEADDVLGTLAATQPGPVEVVSGDRDLFQLVDDERGTRLLYCGRGVAKLEDCDDAAVRDEVRRARPGGTRTSRRCAATRATACPACPASARRRPPG